MCGSYWIYHLQTHQKKIGPNLGSSFFARFTYALMKRNRKEIIEMEFIMTTISFMVAFVLASVLLTVAVFALMTNVRVMRWLTNYYMKVMEKTFKNFEDKWGA